MADLRSQLQDTIGSAYSIERELGGGGMSRVFLALEEALGRRVVVKVLPPELTAGVNVERFKREIQLSAKLQHPHIVPVLTAGEMGDVPYYTMPFVNGESLRARLQRGALSITEGVGILRDVAKALAYAHEQGVAHRDIKPDNILLSGGSATVADFGIAKAISAARSGEGATLTQIGVSIGTPAYMSPEQAAADPATNHRADIYAFGCVAYEVLAGRPPFVEKTPQRLLAAQMGAHPETITALRPDTPASLADLVMRCLEKEADARPQSAADLVRVLETVTSGGGHAALPPILVGGPGMLRKALAYYGAAFVVVAIITQAAIIAIGLPDWVLAGAIMVMLMGLPVILFTAYVQRVARRAITMTPTYTPGGTPSMQGGTMATIAMKASPHWSWQHTARGGLYAFGGFMVLVGAFMAMRALGIGPAGSLLGAGKLEERDRLLVADFNVSGVAADTSLGRVAAEAVRADLSQSKAMLVVPTSVIASALRFMQRPVTSRMDVPLAREIAQREGIKGIVTGDITPLGAGFVVTLRLLTANTVDELATFRETADSPTALIPTLEKLTRRLRGKIGESLRDVRSDPPLAQVTTGSLEALRKYAQGIQAVDVEWDFTKGVAHLKEAVAIDTTFAMAYRKLAVAYNNGGFPYELARAAARKAYEHRDRMSEKERYLAIGYHANTESRRAEAAAAYEAALRLDSLESVALTNLSNIYVERREPARAESLLARGVRTGRAPIVAYNNLRNVLVHQGKLREADSIVALMRAQYPSRTPWADEASILYARRQYDSLATVLERQRTQTSPAGAAAASGWLSDLAQVRGQLAASERYARQRDRIDSARGIPPYALFDSLRNASTDLMVRGAPARATRRLDAALARTPMRTIPLDRRPYFGVSWAYALAGRTDRARAIMAEWEENRDSAYTLFERFFKDLVRAEIALADGRPAEALEWVRRSQMNPDGYAHPCTTCEDVMFARVFDAAGQRDSAVVYFARFVDGTFAFRHEDSDEMLHMALRRLGELHEQAGNPRQAYEMYQRFVELWKNADPELQPRVADVRRRMSRLADIERR